MRVVPVFALFGESCWPGVARHATHFFCVAKKSKQKKATLAPASLRFAAGSLRCSVQPGSKTTRLRLKQVFALIRLDLRSSAHPQGPIGSGDKHQNQIQYQQVLAMASTCFFRYSVLVFHLPPLYRAAIVEEAGRDLGALAGRAYRPSYPQPTHNPLKAPKKGQCQSRTDPPDRPRSRDQPMPKGLAWAHCLWPPKPALPPGLEKVCMLLKPTRPPASPYAIHPRHPALPR